jgi:hypothetical protein
VLRVRTLLVAGVVALSLMLGVAGTAVTVSAQPPKQQPQVVCDYFSQEDTIKLLGFDPGPGGHWECYFVYNAPAPHR